MILQSTYMGRLKGGLFELNVFENSLQKSFKYRTKNFSPPQTIWE